MNNDYIQVRQSLYLAHSGVKGQRWYHRYHQSYNTVPTRSGKVGEEHFQRKMSDQKIFISGSSKASALPNTVKSYISKAVKRGDQILVGDAPGIDTYAQDYLKNYPNVTVYTVEKEPRYIANPNWKVKRINASKYEPGSKEYLRKKDEAMTKDATKGLAVTLKDGSSATRRNIDRLHKQGKYCEEFELAGTSDTSGKWKTNEKLERAIGELNLMKRQTMSSLSKHDVDRIINSLNEDDRNKVLAGDDHYLNTKEGRAVIHRTLAKSGLKNVAFVDMLDDGSSVNIALATDSKYHGKGYASKSAQKAMDWADKHKDQLKRDGKDELVWGVRTDNAASRKIAKKNGFKLDKNSYSDDGKWVNYVKKL